MINPNQNIIKPINIANNLPGPQGNINQPLPNLPNSANNIISNRINQDINNSQMDLFGKKLLKAVGKKDKKPKVGVIETPPYNKTPIENELNRLKLENQKPENKKNKNRTGFDLSGILMIGAFAVGGVLVLSQIKEPFVLFLKRIFNK